RTRDLMLVEDAELHGRASPRAANPDVPTSGGASSGVEHEAGRRRVRVERPVRIDEASGRGGDAAPGRDHLAVREHARRPDGQRLPEVIILYARGVSVTRRQTRV